MINVETVFVLGAGASNPYEFPTGLELTESFWKLATEGDAQFLQALQSCGIGPSDTKEFLHSFRRSRIKSVDAFLEKNADFVNLGKFAIAAKLIPHENPEKLRQSSKGADWYMELWNALHPDARTIQDLLFNRVRFVTFNYDRSLERYLTEAAAYSFRVSPNDAYAVFGSKLNILHVYGQLGAFTYNPANENARVYNNHVNTAALRIAADSIHIMPEERQTEDGFQEARKWFDWAKRICFLGFGFDQINTERLGLDSVLRWKADKNQATPLVVASTLNMTDREVEAAQNGLGVPQARWVPVKSDNLRTLRESGVLLP